MGPKKATGTAAKKATSTHGSYKDMIKAAIIQLKERTGSSRQAITKYVKSNNNLGATTDNALRNHINAAIANGVKSGDFVQPKGPSGTVKLAKKPSAAPKAAAAPKKTTTAKKPAAKKATTATKKTTTAKKATTTKTKANVAKPRKAPAKKTPTAAPAVEEKKPVVMGKTKSGRVTKTTSTPATAKKTASKAKATPKKAAKAA